MSKPLFYRSIRWRLLITMLSLGILFAITLIVIHDQSQNELMKVALQKVLSVKKEMLIEQGRLAIGDTRSQIERSLAPPNAAVLSDIIQATLVQHPEIIFATLAETSAQTALVHFVQAKPRNQTKDRPERTSPVIGSEKNNHITLREPIVMNHQQWGTLQMGFSTATVKQEIDMIREQMAGTSGALTSRSIRIAALFIFTGIVTILYVSTQLANPIIRLTESAQEIARGNFSAAKKLDLRSGDEIGKLSQAFVTMSNDLQASYSDLKRAAEEARRAGSFLDSILDNLPHMVFVKESKNLNFVMLNKAGEALVGRPRSHMLGKNDRDLFPPEQAEFFITKDREVLQSGRTMDIPEEIMTRPDGQTCYLHTRKVPVLDAHGQPEFLVGISEDISRLKNAAEERKLFFNHALDLMCVANMEGYFEQVNEVFVTTLGYSREELCSRPYFDFVHPDDIESTVIISSQLNEGKDVVSFQNRYICKNGNIRWLTWSAGIDREFKKIYATARDTTEQKNVDERIFQAGIKEQERIARDLHDGLGQILTSLAYKGKLMEDMLLHGEPTIPKQASDIVRLANQASEQARMLARGLDPIVMKEGLIMALKDLAHTTSETYGIECSMESDHENDHLDKTTSNHLFRIAQEAVTNAIKHGRSTSISIYVTSDQKIFTMTILNEGVVFSGDTKLSSGLGFHTMNHRAKLIGGALAIIPNPTGGVIVRCTVRETDPSALGDNNEQAAHDEQS